MNSLREDLNAYLQQMTIIDAHEHLMPERDRVARQIDVLSLLSLYAWFDLMSAGLPTKGLKTAIGDNYLTDHRVPLEEKWNRVWPYIQRIKHGSYYRATAIALRDLYGIADLNERTWREANERVSAANRPGVRRTSESARRTGLACTGPYCVIDVISVPAWCRTAPYWTKIRPICSHPS